MGPKILVVEDEKDLATTLAYNLRGAGFRPTLAATGAEALACLDADFGVDLVLLDWMLPDMSGEEVCRRLRLDPARETLPIIMVTARGTETDRLRGFQAGADDYVVKPFSIKELIARVQAVLRRSVRGDGRLCRGILELDPAQHQVRVRGETKPLTALEFKLLHLLLTRQGRVQSREQLLTDVWGYQNDVTTRTVDTHIRRLREKLGDASDLVQTVRGVGYTFRDTPPEA